MLHIVLDAARMGPALATAQELTDKYSSLYKGRSEEHLAAVAPYLFSATDQPTFTNWLVEQGWGQSWGVYLESAALPTEVYRHLRKFLLVRTETGQELYFRFYDPRVLRQFLPTCNTQQLADFFGPVRYFLLEDEDPVFALYYWLENHTLRRQRLDRVEAERYLLRK